MKRLTLILVCIIVLAFSINAMAKVDLTFWFYPTLADPNKEEAWYERSIIAEFEALNPEVHIDYEVIPWAGASLKFSTAIAAGATPDIIWVGDQKLCGWAARGLFLDFEDVLTDKEQADFVPYVYNLSSISGKQYWLPWGVSNTCMMVNLDIAKQAGAVNLLPLDRPMRGWTIKEFEAFVRKVKPYCDEKGYFTLALPGVDNWAHHLWLLMAQWGAELYNVDMTECTINSPAGIKAMEWFLYLKTAGLQVPYPESEPGDTELYYAFADGQAAIYFCAGPSSVASLAKYGTRVVLMQKPRLKGQDPATWISTLGIAAFDNDNPEKGKWAKLFCKFWADKQGKENLLGRFTVKQSVKHTYDSPDIAFCQRMLPYAVNIGISLPIYQEARALFMSELQAMYIEIKTPKQALDDFVEKVNALLAE